MLVCPHDVIDYVDKKLKQVAKATAALDFCGISEGIGCDVCAQVCPRLYPREFQLADLSFGADQLAHSGVKPMEEFENSMKVLLRLARKQHLRVPVPPGRDEAFVRPTEFIGRVG